VSFIVVNNMLPTFHTKRHTVDIFKKIGGGTFELYQDTAYKNLWRLMKGRKDTIYIFDSCGYLHIQLDHPRSHIAGKRSAVVTHLKMALGMKYKNCDTCTKHHGKHVKGKGSRTGSRNKHGKKHEKKKVGKSEDH